MFRIAGHFMPIEELSVEQFIPEIGNTVHQPSSYNEFLQISPNMQQMLNKNTHKNEDGSLNFKRLLETQGVQIFKTQRQTRFRPYSFPIIRYDRGEMFEAQVNNNATQSQSQQGLTIPEVLGHRNELTEMINELKVFCVPTPQLQLELELNTNNYIPLNNNESIMDDTDHSYFSSSSDNTSYESEAELHCLTYGNEHEPTTTIQVGNEQDINNCNNNDEMRNGIELLEQPSENNTEILTEEAYHPCNCIWMSRPHFSNECKEFEPTDEFVRLIFSE